MRVRSELSGRRLAVALVLVALLPGALTALAVTYQRPDMPPGPPAYNPLPLAETPVLLALQARELQRSGRLSEQAATVSGPTLVPATFPEPLPTLVLPARELPYTLDELRRSAPEAFGPDADAVLLRASLEVPTGAHLTIDSATTPNLRLLSSTGGFATIVTHGGTVDITGAPGVPVSITSWDESAAAADTEPADGRAFLLAFGGRMNIAHADIGHLGFGTGTSSGVAWRGADPTETQPATPAGGDVTSSRLHDNWFGAYTHQAQGMRWTGNTFADNAAYGFDPHDFSDDFVVEGNIARGNGRHGFSFSRGGDRNIVRGNVAHDNRGHGFMIDDGRSEGSATAAAARVPSNDNLIVGNFAYDNDGNGVEIEGGTGNVVRDNVLERNHIGVRVKDDASAVVVDNHITDSHLFGIDVMPLAGAVEVKGNEVVGGWAGVSVGRSGGATMSGNVLTDVAAPLVVEGTAVRDDQLSSTLGKYFQWNPLLILWAAILGIPAVLAVKAVVTRAVRSNRRVLAQ